VFASPSPLSALRVPLNQSLHRQSSTQTRSKKKQLPRHRSVVSFPSSALLCLRSALCVGALAGRDLVRTGSFLPDASTSRACWPFFGLACREEGGEEESAMLLRLRRLCLARFVGGGFGRSHTSGVHTAQCQLSPTVLVGLQWLSQSRGEKGSQTRRDMGAQRVDGASVSRDSSVPVGLIPRLVPVTGCSCSLAISAALLLSAVRCLCCLG